MPLYDYQCEAGHRYEKHEPFGSPAQQPCDRCGKPARRLLNAPPIVFKGSGWYATDSSRTFRPGVNEEHVSSDDGASEPADETPAPKPAPKKSARGKAAKPAKASKPAAGAD